MNSPDAQTRARKSEDCELVHRTRRGETAAFEALIAKYQRAVFNIALYKSKNHFDAEDLVQDIFLAAYRALETLRSPENFSSWLFGIAYNRCHKWFQRERTKVVKFEVLRQRVARETRLQQRANSSEDVPLSESLARVPTEIRTVLRFKYLEGLSYQEIEERMGINAHRIDYLIRKGKQMLRERMTKSEER